MLCGRVLFLKYLYNLPNFTFYGMDVVILIPYDYFIQTWRKWGASNYDPEIVMVRVLQEVCNFYFNSLWIGKQGVKL
jgi:hypothetical protein